MPKIPKGEWGQFTDPQSEEYAPSLQEIKDEQQISDNVHDELADIESLIKHGEKDPYTGEKNEFTSISPEVLWDRLSYLYIDYVEKVKDPELKTKLASQIEETERNVYKQFIPFIKSKIYLYGWSHSPLEQIKIQQINSEEIGSYFKQARGVLEHFKISEDDKLDFIVELERLEEKLDRYQNESSLFTFEKIEEELHKDLYNYEFSNWPNYGRATGVLDNDTARQEHLKKFEVITDKAHQMSEIAQRMLNVEIRDSATERALSLTNYIERLKREFEAPREIIATEAELIDVVNRIKQGQQIDNATIESLGNKVADLEQKYIRIDGVGIKRIQKLYQRVHKAFKGEPIDEDEERFSTGLENIDWAWTLLGINKEAGEKDIKSAYKKLVRKYHPDINKSDEANNKSKQINRAFEFIAALKGFK